MCGVVTRATSAGAGALGCGGRLGLRSWIVPSSRVSLSVGGSGVSRTGGHFLAKTTIVSQAYFMLVSVIYVLFELFAWHRNSQLPKMAPHAERFWQLISVNPSTTQKEGRRAAATGARGPSSGRSAPSRPTLTSSYPARAPGRPVSAIEVTVLHLSLFMWI